MVRDADGRCGHLGRPHDIRLLGMGCCSWRDTLNSHVHHRRRGLPGLFILHQPAGVYLGMTGEIPTDFVLHIGEAAFAARESSVPNTRAAPRTGGQTKPSHGLPARRST